MMLQCQLSGYLSIARSLRAINGMGHFRVQSGSSRSLASALRPVIRDPERPVQPATPWLTFLQGYRKEHPSRGQETMAAASKEWKALPDVQKQKFIDPYEAEKKVYEEKMKAYVESGKKEAWERDPDRPKAPPSAFIRFATEFRKKDPSLKLTEASKLAAESWKEMKADEKHRYEAEYKAEKEKYGQEIAAYKASGKEEAWKAKVGIAAQEEKAARKKAKELETKKLAKEKAKKDKEKEAKKAKKLEAKEKEAKKAQKLKEKEQTKKTKEKEAAETKKAKDNAKAAQVKSKANTASTPKEVRA